MSDIEEFVIPEWVRSIQEFTYRVRNDKCHKKYHIRAFVDDHVVVRWWSKKRQCWKYECLDGLDFKFMEKYCSHKGKPVTNYPEDQ